MDVHCFEGADGFWALTRDERGAVLPMELGPWSFQKTLTLTLDAEDEREAQALITQHGYCCFKMDEEPTAGDPDVHGELGD